MAQLRIAVTGANGFVGRQLARLAQAEGVEIHGVVRSKQAARAVILSGAHPVIVGSLEPDALAAAFAGARAVVHLAQIGAERGGATYEALNVEGTRAVIAAARAAAVPRIVFLSGLGVARYGMSRRCTNPYFLSKLAAELLLFRSGLQVCVLRPSYVVGPGGELIPGLLREMAEGSVERIGDGRYRMQPIAARDAAAAILAAASLQRSPAVFDLVGPEPMQYQAFIDRVGDLAREQGLCGDYGIRELPVAEADARAAAGGYRGLLPDELDCLLCDETGDPGPLSALLGRFLSPVDAAIAEALREGAPRPRA